MKRKLKWIAAVLSVLLLGFGAALLLWPRDRITAESWKQIQIGMSEKEVEDILGRPGVSWEANLFPLHFELAESNDTLYIRRWPFESWESDKYWTSQRACIQDLIREAILVEKPSGAPANRPSLTASAIGLPGESKQRARFRT
ncbi:MAG TPA: hypothetical protein VKE98_08730 [Gemmataceae bacterium]|nr:hypothetical protein [Gemmataceae bacterium]